MKMVLGSRRWRCESDGMSGEREREREREGERCGVRVKGESEMRKREGR